MAPTPPATRRMRSHSEARWGNLLVDPYGPSMFSGGLALERVASASSALVVGPRSERRTSVMSLSETSATVKGL